MKINFNGYEVEITAKYSGEKRNSKQTTMFVLNQISIWASEAEKYYNMTGCNALAEGAKEANEEIYEALKAKGLYD